MKLDFMFEAGMGTYTGISTINKFGRATNVDNGIDTDVWDRANATDDQAIWIAPTAARIHDITSVSTSDTSAGGGARTIKISGLTDWTTAEVSEDITMNGTSNVATSNSYVIIHRMQVLTKGAEKVNWGDITATAQTDSTVTAQIISGSGQTKMAIYGIPSTHKLFIPTYYTSLINAGATSEITSTLLINPEPEVELLNFLVKHEVGYRGGGTTHAPHRFLPYKQVNGPAILKIQTLGDTDDMDVTAGFDGILITK